MPKRVKLKTSHKKTKIMVFNRQLRSIDLKLKTDNLVIESCKKYVYLGTVFTPGNNFRTAQKKLYRKACKALFTYLSVINVHTGAQISTVKNCLTLWYARYYCTIQKYGEPFQDQNNVGCS